jgi:hypothetical protein
MSMSRFWLLLPLAFAALGSACSDGEKAAAPTPDAQVREVQLPTSEVATESLSGALYARTANYLIRFDLAARTAEPRKLASPQSVLHETAVVAGNELVLADVSHTGGAAIAAEDEWTVTLHILDAASGHELKRIVLDPLRDVPPPPSDWPDCFCAVGSIHLWYVPQTDTVLVGITAGQQDGTRLFRLDTVDSETWVRRSSIDLGKLPGSNYGGIRVATDRAGNVAVLLTGSPQSRLLISSPDLSSFEPVKGAIADCSTSDAASTSRSEALYFLCLGSTSDGVHRPASLLVVRDPTDVQQYALPQRFMNVQGGTVDAGQRVFIGIANPPMAAVLTLDLATGEIVAQREFELASNSSWRDRLKRFILGKPAYAITVVFEPIVMAPDGSRLFFTDSVTLWCLRPDDLGVVGEVKLAGTQTQMLAMTADGDYVIAAGLDKGIELIDATECELHDTLRYAQPEGPLPIYEEPSQMLVP